MKQSNMFMKDEFVLILLYFKILETIYYDGLNLIVDNVDRLNLKQSKIYMKDEFIFILLYFRILETIYYYRLNLITALYIM